ncbi:ABC transporter permease [Liquorilactobacillus nagelii]|uniref:ABC transporter permease n=1 Tax=Liquorilactobacillus nagelii TaxID=82688 RepID=UPI0006F1869D|nr:ABC transporter permease [Liquorilactobacillus nagelii]KRL41082.1 ABC superfamily ATP binding cassette transporter, membrane protein [Liquorilactobacillus nagelii DSM 13675]QYH54016.1 ABC transporter permease [Liquorilactobacillus nagelii DSM 13675]
MNFIKRAWLNVIRKRGRTLLLILITSAILLFVLSGLMIQSAAEKAVQNAKESAGTTVTLSANRENAFRQMRKQKQGRTELNLASVNLKKAKKIASSKYVKSYNVLSSTTATAKSFKAIKTTTGSSGSSPQGGPMNGNSSNKTSLSLSGVTATSVTSAFTDGDNKIVSGRGITTSDQGTNHVVIEKELAKENNISVGDQIKIKSNSKTVTLKVVGIYRASSSSTSQMQQSDPSNTLYLASNYVSELKGSSNQADSVVYTMKNPAKAAAFIKQEKTLINTSKFSLTTNDTLYQTMLTPLNNIKSFAQKIVWLVGLAGTIILTLIVILMVRERRYESGILLALGERKGKIVLQFLVELLMVLVVSSVIAVGGGKYAGNLLSKQLVQQATTQTVSSNTKRLNNSQLGGGNNSGMSQGMNNPGQFGGATSQNQQQTTNLKLSLSIKTIVEVIGFGLLIITISILLGTINLLRLPPKKILTH